MRPVLQKIGVDPAAVSELLRRHFDTRHKAVPDSVIDGLDVMKALSLKPGPKVGAILEEVREAQAEGRIHTREEALEFLKAIE